MVGACFFAPLQALGCLAEKQSAYPLYIHNQYDDAKFSILARHQTLSASHMSFGITTSYKNDQYEVTQ